MSTPTWKSKARVRTRTGCFECRKRRKKCDEQRPTCQRCANLGSTCTWPTATSQPMDGRRRERRQMNAKSVVLTYEDKALYTHFATTVMPRLVRPSCPSVYSDQSHILRLAREFSPLMAIMIAIAAVDLGNDTLAMQHYLHSLRSLQGYIIGAPGTGNEDGLLATTICLCVFENLRPDLPPNIGLHAKAAGVLLSRRRPEASTQSPSQPVVVFQRTCVESFLYHSTLVMLFNPSLDVTTGDIRHYLAFATNDWQTAPQPLLDESYDFFIMIANVTRLARLSRDLNQEEHQMWTRLQSDILQYERTGDNQNSIRRLYSRAVRILLLKKDPIRSTTQIISEIEALFYEGLIILKTIDVEKYLLSYSLWPVAVLGAAAIGEFERYTINNRISPLVRMRRGQAVRLQERLMNVWASPRGNGDMILQQLQLLMEPS
ncbi:uncharacterized protein N7479_009725 [Penicillium vulpinum]|uniref:uncharacterized protein n=1 Tax=Penicillium vulpinum TaxID=29845 RepID=UPI0025465C65|nr:uncharacterized protein N7479_009725 [Penicillium vulpinum]KAJ5951312.1 hypothetical protein N7479_009725 [Penicillium vulpinum]